MQSTIFDRTQAVGAEISASAYNAIIGVTLLIGFAINFAMVKYIPVEAIASINSWVLIIGFFACCFSGIALFTKSDSPPVSFLGYLLVVTPFGLIINLVVSRYSADVVINAIQATACITFVMMILGTMYPAFFKSIARGLFVALICTIVVEMVMIFVFKTHHTIIDWVVVLIFCGYIGYDWARANSIPKTVDNAIDSAAALYMDIINLFLRLLRILGRR
ncbi:MAG: histidine kinase [Desulfuromonadales bacterium C00003094]|nr:MAG: histidine kinase [Desulfuromonadales bacterium C00003094]